MADKVQIANLALARIGQSPIESFDEDSDAADNIKIFYDFDRQALLRQFPWNFSVKTQELAPTTITPPDWSYEFGLPADMLYLISPARAGRDFTKDQYEVRGNKLVANYDELTVRYVADITDTSLFDALFVQALAYLLAADMAMPMTQKPTVQSNMAAGYVNAVLQARGVNGAESRLDMVEGQEYLNARN